MPELRTFLGAYLAYVKAVYAGSSDVLADLQEVSVHAHGERARHELRALDWLLEATPYASFTRVVTTARSGGPSDRHNLVVLSRLPVVRVLQHWHDLVAPPARCCSAADPPIARRG